MICDTTVDPIVTERLKLGSCGFRLKIAMCLIFYPGNIDGEIRREFPRLGAQTGGWFSISFAALYRKRCKIEP